MRVTTVETGAVSATVVSSTLQRVFCILEQLEDEMSTVVIAIGKQHRADPAYIRTITPSALFANCPVVRSQTVSHLNSG